jgi:hypothetical protein
MKSCLLYPSSKASKQRYVRAHLTTVCVSNVVARVLCFVCVAVSTQVDDVNLVNPS